MRTTVLAIIATFGAAAVLQAADADSSFKDEKAKASYAIGLNIGNNWKRQEIEVDFDSLLAGLKDATEGKPRMTDAELQTTLAAFSKELSEKQQKKRDELAAKNRSEGEAFLARNKAQPGVITTENGLQYKVITEGSGDPPKPEDTVTVNYRGTLVDGTEFDSSAKHGGPATFQVRGVIPGWTEALTMMKPGAKWQLVIPPQLAYGERGSAQVIGPDSTLIFDVELVSVKPAPPSAPRAPLTSDVIKVPSLEEMKKGAKIETIKAEDLPEYQKQEQKKQQEN